MLEGARSILDARWSEALKGLKIIDYDDRGRLK